MIQAQIMHDQGGPVTLCQLAGDMTGHIMVYFGEILQDSAWMWWH